MKIQHCIVIGVAILLIGIGAGVGIGYWLFMCEKPEETHITQGPEHEPNIINKKVKDPYAYGKIHIEGEMIDDNTFRAKAYNDVMSNYRDYTLDLMCPMPKWTFMIGVLGGVGNQPEMKKTDFLMGIEVALFRHYAKYAVGGGGWYMQSLSTQYKAGGLKADMLFSWGRQ